MIREPMRSAVPPLVMVIPSPSVDISRAEADTADLVVVYHPGSRDPEDSRVPRWSIVKHREGQTVRRAFWEELPSEVRTAIEGVVGSVAPGGIWHRAQPGPIITRAANAPRSMPEPDTGRSSLPDRGEWPCQALPSEHLPTRLVAFLYQLVRDGAPAPGDVEQQAINVREYQADSRVDYTNPHLEAYARSLATFLTQPDGVDG